MDVKKVRGGYLAYLENFEVVRPTALQARTELALQIDQALTRCRRAPTVIDTGKGVIVLVWADPNGYSYSIVDSASAPSAAVALTAKCFCNYHDYDEAERAARRHLAQYIFEPNDVLSDDCAWVILDPQDRAGHLSWVRWQRVYADARKSGMSDGEAREYAGRTL